MPLMPMTPPVAAQASICRSVMLRWWSIKARALAWEKITGFSEVSMMSRLVRSPLCEQSIMMPARLMARTTSRP